MITPEFILRLLKKQEGKCALSGEYLTFDNTLCDNVMHESNISVDRIDPKKGYTPDNVQLTTVRVNFMKGTMQQEAFIRACKSIAQNNKYVN